MQTNILYAIISPIIEVVYIKTNLSWSFYKNEELVERYDNIIKVENSYKVNENLSLTYEKNSYILERKTEEYKIIIDFSNKICSINLLNEKLLTEINLLDLEIVDKDDNITIIYKLDEDEINKLVISLKE